MKKCIAFLTVLVFLVTTLLPFGSPVVFAAASINDTILMAVQWIGANQNADGSWGFSEQQKMLDTSTSLEVLARYGYLPEKYQAGIDWLNMNLPNDNNFLARYLSVPDMVSPEKVTQLVSAQTSYGGWGNSAGSSCNNQVTAFALKVLLDNGGYDEEISRAAYHLLSTQNSDGSWGLAKGEPGSIYITGLVRAVLLEFQQKVRCDMYVELDKAADWLLSNKNPDGSWGTVDLTCMAYKGLAFDRWSDVESIPEYLAALQLPNGSWDNNPYTTALVLETVSRDNNESSSSIQDIRLLLDGKEYVSFEANTKFEIVPDYTGHNVTAEINLVNPVGEKISVTPNQGRFYWDTGLERCGDYQAEVTLKDGSGQVRASRMKAFTIKPFIDISQSYVEVTPGASLVNKPVSPVTSIYIDCETNIFEPVNIVRKVYDQNNAEVDSKLVSTALSQGENSISAGSFTANTAAVTTYTVHADITYQGNILATGDAYFKVLDKINSLYTTNADFDRGVLKGLNHNEVADQLQLNKNAAVFPYIWIANAGEGTVSKIDTRTGKEVGRYKTASSSGVSPSRTCVDKEGNCWVGNRLNGTVVKIAMNGGIDKNKNGRIDTSTDKNGNGIIDPGEILAWGQDEAILAVVPVGSGSNSFPRAMAIDKNGRIWVGLYNDVKYVVIDPVTLKPTGIEVRTQDGPYGAAIDSNGYLWSSTISAGRIEKIDTNNPRFIKSYPVGIAIYGIVVDKNGIVWGGGYVPGGQLIRFDPSTGKYTYHYGNGSYGRGVAVDNDGNIWQAYSGNNWVSKFDSNGKYLLSVNIGARGCYAPIGVGVDGDGCIWVSCNSSSNTVKMDTRGNILGIYKTGANPYTYSDMTGFNLQNITTHEGTWTITHDGGYIDSNWDKINWTSEEPQNTVVTVRARAANTPENLAGAAYVAINKGQPITSVKGRFMQVEVKLSTSDASSPIVKDVEIIGSNAVAIANAGEDKYIKLASGDLAKVMLDGTKSYDPNGSKLTYKWTWDGKSAVGPRPTIILPLGTTEITLVVNNGISDSQPDKVSITVADANGITTVPQKPAVINTTANSTSVTLLWDAILGATGYDVEVDGNIIDNQTFTKYVHSGLDPETQHVYRVRGKNSRGAGEWSDLLTVSTISAAAEIGQALAQLENAVDSKSTQSTVLPVQTESGIPDNINTLESVNEVQVVLDYLRDLMNLVPDAGERDPLIARVDVIQAKLDIANVTEKIEVLVELKEDLSLSEPIENALSGIQEQISLLPDSEVKDNFIAETEKIEEEVETNQVVVKIGILEAMVTNLGTQELIDQAQQYLDEVQQNVNEFPEEDIRDLLQSRVNAAQLEINIAQTELKVKIAEETIVSEDVDSAQQCNLNLPEGDIRSGFQARIDFVMDVIEASNETYALQNSLEDFEKSLQDADLTSNEQVGELETVFDAVYAQSNEVNDLLVSLPETDKPKLVSRIEELKTKFEPIPGLLSSIQVILVEAQDNYKGENGNAEIRFKARKDSAINLFDLYKDIIQQKLESVDNLRWLSINKELAVVNSDGEMEMIKNGIAKITVYNDRGKIDMYAVISMDKNIDSVDNPGNGKEVLPKK